ncbi:MAG TPA: hypothetical protein ENN51_03515 [candidate division WOR-3 bacterium]|uniref:Uncharacterized protein n=1 Tax=candidate division WOR-3 bacterium TaxID=2052148 RepID=A0A7V0XES8_UNCW3|nr:hypothetical protein [candidate division WOR-3 bacterium]
MPHGLAFWMKHCTEARKGALEAPVFEASADAWGKPAGAPRRHACRERRDSRERAETIIVPAAGEVN